MLKISTQNVTVLTLLLDLWQGQSKQNQSFVGNCRSMTWNMIPDKTQHAGNNV